MEDATFDLVIIGAGPAGEKAAAQAAYFGKSVAIVEAAREPGGAAVHTGTLPSKTLRESALYLSGHRGRDLYGVALELGHDATLRSLNERTAAIAAREAARYRHNFARHGVRYIEGVGRFEDAKTVCVDGPEPMRLRASFVLIATGSEPRRPANVPFASPLVHDTDEVVDLDALPRSIIVLGAGVIGCEYACMFAALGIHVTLVDPREDILSFLDVELVDRLRVAMTHLGITQRLGTSWGDVELVPEGVATTLADGTRLVADHLLFAAGRVGRTRGLDLPRIGLVPNARGYIDVDDAFRTSVPGVLAVGDVIGFPALASVSMEQGRVAVCRAFGFAYKAGVGALLPYGIYTIPEVSSVGESEASARAKGIDFVVGRALFAENPRGMIAGDLEGMTKLLVERGSRRIIGAHVIGERASELVHIGQTAMVSGATIDVFIDMVFNFPTLAESYKYAAYACLGALGRGD